MTGSRGERPLWYDRNGNPISDREWSTLKWHTPGYHRVGRDEIAAGGVDADGTIIEPVVVSTVWLGLDHSFLRKGPPLIFETMIFGGTLDGAQERYSTAEQATAGHQHWVTLALTEVHLIEAADLRRASDSHGYLSVDDDLGLDF